MASVATHADEQLLATEDAIPPVHVLILVAALAAGVVAQGGYYPAGRVLVTILVTAALVVGWRAARWSGAEFWPVPLAAGALALWILIRAVLADEYPTAFAAVATLGCLVAGLLILRRTDAAQRESSAETLIWLGALVAATAWLGVALRLPRFAILVENRLWRGASTLTYPNAAAALLVPLTLLALALLVARPRSVPRAAAGYLLLVGVGATLSRAGFLALLAGFVVLAVVARVRAVVWNALPLVLGAAIAVAALLPSVPRSAEPRPVLAGVGLLAGAAVAVGPVLLPGRARAAVVTAVLGVAGIVAATQLRGRYLDQVWASRGNLDSSGRSGALRAAFDMVAQRPFTGTGVGLARFLWDTPDGNGAVALYVHNEYVQTLVDLGGIGFALLLALFAALAVHLYRGRRYPHRPGIRAGVFAALAAFAVHSGFDFLWHVAVLPLVGGFLVGLAGPAVSGEPISPEQEGEQ
jgi:hypothetical protein